MNLHHALDRRGYLLGDGGIQRGARPWASRSCCWCCGSSSLLLTIASGELAKPDWDLEWLITLPIRSDTLLWARILERSVVNPSGALALLPACTVIAWFSGFRWSAPVVGVLAAWPLLLLAALVRTLLDTGLRLTTAAGATAQPARRASPCCPSSPCISRSRWA